MSLLNVNTIEPSTGTDITLGASGDTITVPSGATFTQSGTMNASAITAGTLAIAQGGTGAATLAAAGLANTPNFHVYLNSSQTTADTALTKVNLDTEVFDSGNYFASYKWTPSSGTYFVYAQARFQINAATTNLGATIKKNGSDLFSSHTYGYYYTTTHVFGTVSMNGTDYLELFAVQNSGSTQNISNASDATFMGGYKLIGA